MHAYILCEHTAQYKLCVHMHVWFIYCPCLWVMRLTVGTLRMQQGQCWLMGLEGTSYDMSLFVWWGQTAGRFWLVGLCLPPSVQFPQADACLPQVNYEWNTIRNKVFLNESQCQNVIWEKRQTSELTPHPPLLAACLASKKADKYCWEHRHVHACTHTNYFPWQHTWLEQHENLTAW